MTLVSLLVSIFSGYCAYACFNSNNNVFGWLNVALSALNFVHFMIGIGL